MSKTETFNLWGWGKALRTADSLDSLLSPFSHGFVNGDSGVEKLRFHVMPVHYEGTTLYVL